VSISVFEAARACSEGEPIAVDRSIDAVSTFAPSRLATVSRLRDAANREDAQADVRLPG
jgi:hypothetical protein